LRADDVAELRRIARLCTVRDAVCLLDMHDFGRYREATLGDPSLPADFFARTWRLIASQLASERVWFGLMNEPHDQDMDKAMAQFQAAARAIRETGHSGRILVPSGGWSGAHSFPRGGNVDRFKAIQIEGEWSIELHQYLDPDNSGTHHAVHVPGKGARVLAECTATLRANGWTGVLAEYGWSDTADGNREGNDLIASIQDAPDVWVGHAYWATGPWWKDYPYAIGPTASNGQLAVLKRYM
jgi:endoglucanase